MDEKQKEYILENVIYKVVNADRNRKILEAVPHKTFLDLAAVYVVLIESDDDDIGYILDNDIMETAGITFDEVDHAAHVNTKMKGFKVYGFDMPLLVGKENNFGAAAFLYPECFKDFLEVCGEYDLYILPSSIYELIIIVDYDGEVTEEKLRETVREINSIPELVGESEFLSNNIYRYIAAENEIIMLQMKGEKEMFKEFLGRKVIVRGDRSGVFFGTLVAKEGQEVKLEDCRRLWFWDGAASISQLSAEGTVSPDNCKFTMAVNEIIITDVIEIILCTDKAVRSIEDVSVWKR